MRMKAEKGPIIEKFTLRVYFPGLVNITASHENRGFQSSERGQSLKLTVNLTADETDARNNEGMRKESGNMHV